MSLSSAITEKKVYDLIEKETKKEIIRKGSERAFVSKLKSERSEKRKSTITQVFIETNERPESQRSFSLSDMGTLKEEYLKEKKQAEQKKESPSLSRRQSEQSISNTPKSSMKERVFSIFKSKSVQGNAFKSDVPNLQQWMKTFEEKLKAYARAYPNSNFSHIFNQIWNNALSCTTLPERLQEVIQMNSANELYNFTNVHNPEEFKARLKELKSHSHATMKQVLGSENFLNNVLKKKEYFQHVLQSYLMELRIASLKTPLYQPNEIEQKLNEQLKEFAIEHSESSPEEILNAFIKNSLTALQIPDRIREAYIVLSENLPFLKDFLEITNLEVFQNQIEKHEKHSKWIYLIIGEYSLKALCSVLKKEHKNWLQKLQENKVKELSEKLFLKRGKVELFKDSEQTYPIRVLNGEKILDVYRALISVGDKEMIATHFSFNGQPPNKILDLNLIDKSQVRAREEAFMGWLLVEIYAMMKKETAPSQTQAKWLAAKYDSLEKELKELRQIPILSLLQCATMNAYSRADEILRNTLFPNFYKVNALAIKLRCLPGDTAFFNFEYNETNSSFTVTTIRKISFCKGHSDTYENFGSFVVHWSLYGSLNEPDTFSGSLTCHDLNFQNETTLETRLAIGNLF